MNLLLLSLFAILLPAAGDITYADEATCLRAGTTCSEVDIEAPGAEAAYRKGCDANDFYACSRLGQFFEVKKLDREKAVAFYDRGCKGKDVFGCEQGRDLHLSLCYLDAKKKFCDFPASGEYRALLFLRDLDPKYADSLRDHNFDNVWELKQTGELFQRRVKEKNPKLLKALVDAKKKGHHDGADAESLSYYIQCVKKKCPEDDPAEL